MGIVADNDHRVQRSRRNNNAATLPRPRHQMSAVSRYFGGSPAGAEGQGEVPCCVCAGGGGGALCAGAACVVGFAAGAGFFAVVFLRGAAFFAGGFLA
jgi:hypothetical protein